MFKNGAKYKGVFSVGLLSLLSANTERLFLLAYQIIGGTYAIPLGICRPSTKYNCLFCALVYHNTALLSLFGLICRMFVGKIPFDFKKALSLSFSVCNAFANTFASRSVKGWALIGLPFLSISKCSTYTSVFAPLVS